MLRLGEEYGVDLPICQVVDAILYRGAEPAEALRGLFDRSIKGEFDV